MSDLWLVFLAGAAGSMHCAGMCGGFACGLGPAPGGRLASWLRHLSYNVGRICSYAFLGTLAGYLGMLLVGHAGEASAASMVQRGLAILSGLLMLLIGLNLAGLFRGGSGGHALGGAGAQWLAQSLRTLLRQPGAGAPLAFGVLNGLLPCPLVYAFAAQAAASGTALGGLQVMIAFGLGTLPTMLAMGGLGLWWRGRRRPAGIPVQPVVASFLPAPAARPGWRMQGVRAAGAFIVLLGLITLARGMVPFSVHLH
ncbi:sulfite exporter TauE/SafE family protein [Cupriavidus sp. AcVe19-6a]|uniref:sulfite exporter TauE/SafE family protein n=1 Tax=Cupriavidus sp. AcVe19-6a TaxID=2821358 RepID=UPI001AE7D2CF|nr:sulfite exporter TauE/SafE family protein [Cupriavidus sp. AcVe19-6a]MBP0634161.1 sulfite exporter TauE/SafE family protein [Cupriavidus sp. AcVe19-6a]